MAGSNGVSESHVDVLIVGAGPAGLAAAYWMTCYGVKARIVDKRSTKIFTGHADGLRIRTLELFDSMGIEDRVEREGKRFGEFRVWTPDEEGNIQRVFHMPVMSKDKSPLSIFGLNQGRIERFMLDAIKEHSPDLTVERGVLAEGLEYDELVENDHEAYPIAVTLRTLSEQEANPSRAYGILGVPRDLEPDDLEELVASKNRASEAGKREVVRVKYLIGCDGAHSWTRKQLGIPMEGSATDHLWGVMDIVPISNFPDMRYPAAIRSESGAILLIPREKGLVRMYIPPQDAEDGEEEFDKSKLTLDLLKKTAQRILKPYDFDFKICDWWSAYQVGQRVAPRMSNNDSHRILLAGEATHTHSPKVGAGMNVSMQDGYNAGWKDALCAKGVLEPAAVLHTYNLERHPVARGLAEFDASWSSLFTSKLAAATNGAATATAAADTAAEAEAAAAATDDPRAFGDTYNEYDDFAQGFVLGYAKSPLVLREPKDGSGRAANLATTLVAGERFFPAKLAAQADGQTAWSTRVMRSDGCFRIVLLAGDVRAPAQAARVAALCEKLTAPGSLLARYLPPKAKEALVDVMAVHCAPRNEVELFDFPKVLRPVDEKRGVSYDKIYVDDTVLWDQECDGMAYEKWGVDRSSGAVLIMRPDQYIGWIGNFEDYGGIESYFTGVLRNDNQRD